MIKMSARLLSSLTLIAFIYLFLPLTSYGQSLHVYILNVGQGDSALISTPQGKNILIDGGPDESVVKELDSVLPFWNRKIDAIIPTHPQADHITGLISVIKRYYVKKILTTPATNTTVTYAAMQREIKEQHIPEVQFLRGSEARIEEGVVLKSLWPNANAPWQAVRDLNDVAQVCELQFHDFSALFTADAGANVEQKLDSLDDTQKVTLLKVPHHGSRFGMDDQYLQKISPLISVISVGKNNHYGHPAPQALDQLQRIHTKILRTDKDGLVDIMVDKAGVSLKRSGVTYN
jgi:competence protein ComEC